MTRRKTYRIAIGGVLTATAVLVMLLGSVIPLATFVAPCLAALCVLYFCIEFGNKTAIVVYAAISLTAALLAPDKELAFVFVFVTGYYPIVKTACEKLKSKLAAFAIKLAVFNAAILLMYFLLIRVIIYAPVKSEFEQYGPAMLIGLIVVANLTFLIYDVALARLARLYDRKLRAKLSIGGK